MDLRRGYDRSKGTPNPTRRHIGFGNSSLNVPARQASSVFAVRNTEVPMLSSRCSSLFFFAIVFSGFFSLRSQEFAIGQKQADDSWKNHPALAEPDGTSHRGDKMVAADIKDERVLDELSRRYKATKRFRINPDGISGADDFERRQEYLLRLLDHYWFSKERLVGMTRAQVENIFGPLGGDPARAYISAGRDIMCLRFHEGRLVGACYVMGY